MAKLPLLLTGAPAQYPFTRTLETRSRVLKFSDGREQRFPLFQAVRRKWRLTLHLLSDGEAAALESFVEQQGGRGGVFEFDDPIDGAVAERCRLAADTHEAAAEGWSRNSTTVTVVEDREG
jgi:phage-related protein